MSPRAMTDLRPASAMRLVGAVALSALLAGCGAEAPDLGASTVPAPAVPGSAQQVEARIGETWVTAVALQTSQLPAGVAAEHEITQHDDLLMLRVSARHGEIGNISSAPVQVHATVQSLGGGDRTIPLTEHVTNGLVDHVGMVEVELPATLQFEVAIVTAKGERGTLEFSRRFEER